MDLSTLFRRKSIDQLQGDDHGHGPQLKRVLTAWNLIVMGVGATIGTGLFVLIGPAINNLAHPELSAGPSIVLAVTLCGLGLLLVAFAFGELSSLIPISGSSYTYAYATLGELPAWTIGWDLILEYAFGASAIAVGWSAYTQFMLSCVEVHLPSTISHAPKEVPWYSLGIALALLIGGYLSARKLYDGLKSDKDTRDRILGVGGLIVSIAAIGGGVVAAYDVVRHLTSVDLPAMAIVFFLNMLLIRGTEHTAKWTTFFVYVKLAAIVMFVALGIWHFDPQNLSPFTPNGIYGMMNGAGSIFFAFIGFDALTCHAEECRDPQKDMKLGILGTLGISTFVYITVALTIVAAVPWQSLVPAPGQEHQEGAAFILILQHFGHNWAVPLLSVGILASITSVLILSLSSQARIMMRLSKDGLVPEYFGAVHPQYQTPYKAIRSCGWGMMLLAGLLPIGELAELTSIGTLAAFVQVCLGVVVLRVAEPNRPRKFKCPDLPWVPPVLLIATSAATWFMFHNGFSTTFVVISSGLAVSSLGFWIAQRAWGVPWIPAAGALLSFTLMCFLPWVTWERYLLSLAASLLVYFAYGRRHSKLNKA